VVQQFKKGVPAHRSRHSKLSHPGLKLEHRHEVES
jgi:hypothetical protein